MNVLTRRQLDAGELLAVEADITTLEVDAVVNAANELLAHDGGVAAAISRAGGPVIQEESDAWVAEHGPIRTGRTAVTSAGNMPSRWVVHTMGPRYRAGHHNANRLRSAVKAALDRCAELEAQSIAMPAISAGIFGYPPDEATSVIVGAVRDWLVANSLREILLVGRGEAMAQLFAAAIDG